MSTPHIFSEPRGPPGFGPAIRYPLSALAARRVPRLRRYSPPTYCAIARSPPWARGYHNHRSPVPALGTSNGTVDACMIQLKRLTDAFRWDPAAQCWGCRNAAKWRDIRVARDASRPRESQAGCVPCPLFHERRPGSSPREGREGPCLSCGHGAQGQSRRDTTAGRCC